MMLSQNRRVGAPSVIVAQRALAIHLFLRYEYVEGNLEILVGFVQHSQPIRSTFTRSSSSKLSKGAPHRIDRSIRGRLTALL